MKGGTPIVMLNLPQ